jgi:hypothetical protein
MCGSTSVLVGGESSMGPRSDLDVLEKNDMFSCARIRPIVPLFVHCVALSLCRQTCHSYGVGFVLRNTKSV